MDYQSIFLFTISLGISYYIYLELQKQKSELNTLTNKLTTQETLVDDTQEQEN